MVKKCIYCKTQVDDSSVIDFCDRCGVGVWGEKMFKAIKASMEKARDSGDLNQGSVSEGAMDIKRPQFNTSASSSFARRKAA